MRTFSFFLILSLCYLFSNAQITTYYPQDFKTIHDAQKDIEYQHPTEGNLFHIIRKQGKMNDKKMLIHLNAERAYYYLAEAPATIVSFVCWGDATEFDNMPYAIGAKNIAIQLINCSMNPLKAIKNITFNFTFFNEAGVQMYDINTGNKFCSLTFSELKGRSKYYYSDDQHPLELFNCYHLLTLDDATSKILFHNNNASICKLESVNIDYYDGTKSSEVALTEKRYTSVQEFLRISPFASIFESYDDYLSYIETLKSDLGNDDLTLSTIKIDCVVKDTQPNQETEKYEKKQEPEPKDDEVYKSATQMPIFSGGDINLMDFINKNIQYPQAAKDNRIQGTVVVQFVVTKTGKLGEIKIVRGCFNEELNNEALRVCKMLTFSPGLNSDGEPINVWYTIPVKFKLPDAANKLLLEEWENIYNELYPILSSQI